MKKYCLCILFSVFLAGCQTYNVPKTAKLPSKYYQIEAKGRATQDDFKRILLENNPELSPQFAYFLAGVYVEECNNENINADIAFAQMCHETDFLRFGGQVKKEQNNFAGIGATDDGAEGASFPSVRMGVRAQVQHLKAYASRDNLNKRCVDPRFERVQRGTAPTLFDLTGKWATDPDYAWKVEAKMCSLYGSQNKLLAYLAQLNPFKRAERK